jgi:hypothetical protein
MIIYSRQTYFGYSTTSGERHDLKKFRGSYDRREVTAYRITIPLSSLNPCILLMNETAQRTQTYSLSTRKR